MKNKITPEERAKIEAIREKWINSVTYQATDEQITSTANEWYAKLGLGVPRIVITSSPYELVIVGAALARCAVARVTVKQLMDSRFSVIDDWVYGLTKAHMKTDKSSLERVSSFIRPLLTHDETIIDNLLYGLESITDESYQTMLSESECMLGEHGREKLFFDEIEIIEEELKTTALKEFGDQINAKREAVENGKKDPGEPQLRFLESNEARIEMDIKVISQLLRGLTALQLPVEDLRRLTSYAIYKDMCKSYVAETRDTILAGIRRFVRSQPFHVGWFWRQWSAFYNMAAELGVDIDRTDLRMFTEWNDYCSMWTAYEGLLIVSRNPVETHRENNILTNTSGPAVRWSDGFSIWKIDGVVVDEQIVMRPETLNAEIISQYESEEVRRVAIERYGWEKYLVESKATKVDERHNKVDNSYEVLWKTPVGITVLMCGCPTTGRVYSLPVLDSCRSCEEAQSFLSSGLSAVIEGAS